MKKSGLILFLVVIFAGISSGALAQQCELVPVCSDYGYVWSPSNCTLGSVKCPFNPLWGKCDEEGDIGDFKFSLKPEKTNKWVAAASKYNDKFIVGAYKSGTMKYCGVINQAERTSSFKSHSHGSGRIYSELVKGDRRSGTASGKSIRYGSKTTYYNVACDPTNGISGSGTGGAETYPVHKVVQGYFYNGLGDAGMGGYNTDITCDNGHPDCAELGYVDQTTNCPGSYVKCPFNQAQVKCDLQAQAGEIKFSLQSESHDGWLKCDGTSLSSKGTAYAKSELASILSSNGLGEKLPNYKGVFLRIGSSVSNSLKEDKLQLHSHGAKAKTWEDVSGKDDFKNGTHDYLHVVGEGHRVLRTTDLTGDSTLKGDETRPPHYAANVFIYSGKLNVQ